MKSVRTPVPGFNGVSAGVEFTDGVGQTDDPSALRYFAAAGYQIDDDVERFHTGSGWYELPDGKKVRGRDNAETVLKGDG